MVKRRKIVIAMTLLTATTSCGSLSQEAGAEPDSTTTANGHTRVETQVPKIPIGVERTRSAVVESPASLIPDSIKGMATTFLDIGDTYGKAKDSFELAGILANYLGIYSAGDPNAQFNSIKNDVEATGRAISWVSTMQFIDGLRGQSIWAMDSLSRQGTVAEGSNEDQSSGSAADAIAGGSAFYRPFSEAATDGLWKMAMTDRPDVGTAGPNLVYDWRLGAPALIELTAFRLSVIAGMDSNFRWNDRYDVELRRLRDALLSHYNKMLDGVRCVADHPTGRALGVGHICADIYTGLYARYQLFGGSNDPPVDVELKRLASEVKQAMPLFEMRALIDTLNFYIKGSQDLTDANGDIRVANAPNLCLDVPADNQSTLAPLQVYSCNWGNNQWWLYDRQQHAVWSPETGLCLDINSADAAAGTPVLTYWCSGGNSQKWTWDPDTGILQNALGTVLDIQYGVLTDQTPVWTWPLNGSASQQWFAPQNCSNVCTVTPGPLTPCNQPCGALICFYNPECCQTQWDSSCVDAAIQLCALKCS